MVTDRPQVPLLPSASGSVGGSNDWSQALLPNSTVQGAVPPQLRGLSRNDFSGMDQVRTVRYLP